jgi:hypothetical protein
MGCLDAYGYVKSTKDGAPWELIAIQVVSSREEARWIEYNLKKRNIMPPRLMETFHI